MKVYLDRPAGLWRNETDGTAEFRFAFDQMCKALLRSGLPFEVFERRPGLDQTVSAWLHDGIYYAYHAEQPGPRSFCFKRGPLPYLWHMDPCGYSGWAEIAVSPEAQARAAEFDLLRAREVIARYRMEMQTGNLSLLPQPTRAAVEQEIEDLGDFVFYPLQVNEDMVLKLAHLPQYEAIRTAAQLAGQRQRNLVLKRHPLCTSRLISEVLDEVRGMPNVHISEASSNTLLEHCRAVLVTNSSMGLHGLIWGRPVFSMGRSEYAHMTYPITAAGQIAQVFDPLPGPVPERWLRQLGHLLAADLVDIRDSACIAARVRSHIDAATQDEIVAPSAGGTSRIPQPDDDMRRMMSNLHLLERQVREELDFVLARYGTLPESEREALRNILAGLARDDSHLARILPRTDPIVALKCLRFFHSRNDAARVRKVIAAQAQQPEAPTGQLFLYARWLSQNGHAEQALPLLERAAVGGDCTDVQLRFVCAALLKASAPAPERARALARRAVTMAPEAADNHFWLARAAWAAGDAAEARKALQTLLNRAPDHEAGLALQARIPVPPAPKPVAKPAAPKPAAKTPVSKTPAKPAAPAPVVKTPVAKPAAKPAAQTPVAEATAAKPVAKPTALKPLTKDPAAKPEAPWPVAEASPPKASVKPEAQGSVPTPPAPEPAAVSMTQAPENAPSAKEADTPAPEPRKPAAKSARRKPAERKTPAKTTRRAATTKTTGKTTATKTTEKTTTTKPKRTGTRTTRSKTAASKTSKAQATKTDAAKTSDTSASAPTGDSPAEQPSKSG